MTHRGVRPIGFVLGAAAALIVAVLAHDVVTRGVLSAHDVSVVAWFAAQRRASADIVMAAVSLSGGAGATSIYAAALIVTAVSMRRLRAAAMVGTIVYGAALLNVVVKDLVQRPRPALAPEIARLGTYSFPSGHAVASTVFAGLVCALYRRSGLRGIRFGALVASSIAWVALVCLSRVYFGLHFPTDVVAGVAEGFAWLMLWLPFIEPIGHFDERRSEAP